MNNFWNWITGENGQLAIAGSLGGMVRWLTLREDWRSGLTSLLVGAICAVYLGPVAIPTLEPVIGKIGADAASSAGLSGFIIGIGGIAVAGFVIDLWKARRQQISGGA